MLPDRVSNPGLLTYESDALLIAPRGPAQWGEGGGGGVEIMLGWNNLERQKMFIVKHLGPVVS